MSRFEANRERMCSLEQRFDHEQYSPWQNLSHKTHSLGKLGKVALPHRASVFSFVNGGQYFFIVSSTSSKACRIATLS